MITVLFFAQLREQLQSDKVDLVIETPCSIAAIQAMVTTDHMVNTGDEVAFFPPVTGG
jgi:molybdopterin converting factor small subunit